MHSVNWPVMIAVYLFIAGMGVAAFYTGMMANLISRGKFQKMAKYGSYIAIPSVLLGLMMLIIDLGRPLYFWHFVMAFRPTSTMSIGTWSLTIFTISAGIYMLTWLAEEDFAKDFPFLGFFAGKRGLRKVCGLIALPLSFMIAGYTGVLLAQTSSALWSSTPFFGLLFLISATSTGMAALMLVYAKINGEAEVISNLAKADSIVILFEIIALVILLVSLRANSPEAASVLLSGDYSLLFWVGIILCGLLVPFGVELYEIFTSRAHAIPAIKISVVTGLLVLAGGFLMRYVMLYAGQIL